MLSNSWRALLFNLEHKSKKKRIISGLSQFLCLISLAFISITFVRKKGKVNTLSVEIHRRDKCTWNLCHVVHPLLLAWNLRLFICITPANLLRVFHLCMMGENGQQDSYQLRASN